uniref:AT-rich interaction domain 5A n=1 Tax=Terrapene triunguis TaxID=2587831 RepID=A0A674HX30_9SAUR
MHLASLSCRLVLPYVRHLKGEDDKPLPPAKPRKQYKVSREPRGEQGDDAAEKSKRVKKEKSGDQVQDCAKLGQAGTPPPQGLSTSQLSVSCHSNCRAHGCSEAYKRLFSSFYFKGNHGIMSPLAKKKLLAQVSKAESLHCDERHLSHSQACHPPNKGAGAPCPKGSLKDGSSGRHLSPAPATFTGHFHTYRSEVLKPVSCHPLRANLPRKRQEGTDGCVEQPEDLRSKASQAPPSWSRDSQGPSAFYKGGSAGSRGSPYASVKACWVPHMTNFAKASPQLPKNGGLFQPIPQSQVGSPGLGPGSRSKRSLEEEGFVHGKKLKAVSPLVKGVEPKDKRSKSPSLQPGLAKPQAVVPSPSFPAPLPSAAGQDSYKGTMLRFPVNFGTHADHLKGQSSPLIPSLSVNPFVIPAFPGHLLAASTQSSDLCRPLAASLVHYPTSYDSSLRHRLYPVTTWHNQPTYASPHGTTFHRNNKL